MIEEEMTKNYTYRIDS